MKKTTTPNDDPKAAAKLHELIEDIAVAMLTTVTPDGALRSRPMFTREVVEERELWFLFTDDSGIASDLSAEQAVNLSYAAPSRDRYVSVTGNASVVHDDAKLEKLWDARFDKYFPGGLDNPHLALLRVRVESAEYWDGAGSKTLRASDFSGKAAPKTDHVKVEVREARASG